MEIIHVEFTCASLYVLGLRQLFNSKKKNPLATGSLFIYIGYELIGAVCLKVTAHKAESLNPDSTELLNSRELYVFTVKNPVWVKASNEL